MNSNFPESESSKLTMTKYTVNSRTISVWRPSQARTIPLKATSNRGKMPSLKKTSLCKVLDYESVLEHDFLLLLDHDPNCIDLQPQPIKIQYIDENGEGHSFFPDCWGLFSDGSQWLFEIKPEKKLKKLLKSKNWQYRKNALEEECKKLGWKFKFLTQKEIRCTRLLNLKYILNAAKHYSPHQLSIDKLGPHLTNTISQLVQASELTLSGLIEALIPLTDNSILELVSIIKNQIYFGNLQIDWDTLSWEAIISIKQSKLIPVYDLPKNYIKKKSDQDILLDLENPIIDKIKRIII